MNNCEDNSGDLPDDDAQLHAMELQGACSVFPVHLYQDLYADLHESARWTIHYQNVEQCLDATAEILAAGSRSVDDKVNVDEFVRNVLADAIVKGVVESNHKTWSAEVRAHLLNTCIALASACCSGLASLRLRHDDVWSAGATSPVRRVDIVSQLLGMFGAVFDQRYSSFAPTFAREPVPSECMDKVHRQYRFLPGNIPNWTRAVAAKFIEMEGFVRIFEVLQLVPMGLRHIDNFLRPLEFGDYMLKAQLNSGSFETVEVQPVAALDFVLSQIQHMLDPEDATAPNANDADLVLLPQILMKLHCVLKVFHSEDDAFSKILVAHVAHLQALLAKRSFATLLILAQQANMLFNPGHKDGPRPAACLKPLLSWICDQQVAQQLLGANLHQRQYVDALRDFLLYLTKSGYLADTTITKLIANMLQDGVMDVEKDNISRLLKDIIPVADLDIVMAAKNAIAPASIKTSRDAVSVFLVTLAMAQNPQLHQKEGLVLECLDIGWSLLLSAEHSHLVITSGDSRGHDNLFAWVVMKADATWHLPEPDQVPEYSKLYASRCLHHIKQRQHLPEMLHTLRSLLNAFKEPLMDPQEALTAVVTSLGDWIQAFTDTAHSNGAAPPLSPASFSIPFRRYLELIQFIVLKTGFPDPESAMPADLILGLWENTVCAIPEGSSSLEQDVEFAFAFFACLVRAKAVPMEAVCELINNPEHLRPPQHITPRSLDHLFHIMLYANSHLGTLVETNELPSCLSLLPSNEQPRTQFVVNGSGNVVGMEYLFQVLTHALDGHVAQEAANMLVRVYIKSYCDFGRCPSSWTSFVSEVVSKLVGYATTLMGADDDPSVNHKDTFAAAHDLPQDSLCGFVQRTLLLLISILDWCHGFSMPIQRPHHASAKGLQVEMAAAGMLRAGLTSIDSTQAEVDIALDRDKGKILLAVHSLMYIGDIRKFLEQIGGCKPGTLHLIILGQERADDSLQLGTIMQPMLDASGGINPLTVQVKQARFGSRDERVLAAPAALHVLSDEVREAILESSPDVKMSADASLIKVLTCLLDIPPKFYEVHQHAYQLLIRLQTWQPLVEALRCAMADSTLQSSHSDINTLFYLPPHSSEVKHNGTLPSWRPRPGAVLYTLEALYALMEPAIPSTAGSQDAAFTCCPNRTILTVIEAADAHFDRDREDKFFWLQYYHTVAKVLKWVLAHAKLPPGADPAETSQTTGAEGPRQLKSSQQGIGEEVVSAHESEAAAADSIGNQKSADVPSMIGMSDSVAAEGRPGADAVLESSSSSDRAAGTLPKVTSRQSMLEPDVLGKLLKFWVVLATRLSKGLPEPESVCGRMGHRSWCMNSGPTLSDRLLLDEVMMIIKSLVGIRQDLLEGVIFGQSFRDMATELLFNSLDHSVRGGMRDLVSLCAGSATPAGRCHLLTIMARPEMAEIAEGAQMHCQQYFEALASIVQTAADADDGESVPRLQQLFVAEFAVVQGLQPQATERTLGHLTFLHSLWRFFVEHPSHAPQEMLAPMRDNGTVELILDSLLFPEARLMAKYHLRCSDGAAVDDDVDDDAIADDLLSADTVLPATTLSPEARTMAYTLLHTMVMYSDSMMSYCLQRLVDMLGDGPPNFSILRQQTTEHRVAAEGTLLDCRQWCGLTNAGATCYMNAVLQQLFMQPTVRALVLALQVPGMEDEDEDTLFQIQRTFAHLALSTARAFTPSGVWASLKDLEGQPVNVMEHQDAHEHLYQLHNIIDGNEIETCETKPMFAAMGGTSVLRIRCRTVDYESRRTEPFTHISVDVQNMHHLERALHAYFQEELMEGDNAYHCDKVNAKVPAIKRTLLAKLPHTFVVQLKRFEFDFKNGMRVKIQERFEFPNKLNLRKFSEAALLEAEAAEASAAAGADSVAASCASQASAMPEGFFEYELKGVVVHIGSAFAGHYYSFVKERGADGRWLCMDDTSVTLWDPSKMEECCFGGQGPDGRMRPNSAYMLVYERQDSLEPVVVKEELQQLVRGAAKNGVGICGNEVFLPPQRMLRASGANSLLEDPLALGLPQRLFAEVMDHNLLMSHAANWTSPSHLCFMKTVVTDCLQINSSSDCHDIRHSMASGSISGVKTMSCDTRDTSSKRLAIAVPRTSAVLDSAAPIQDTAQPLALPAAAALIQEAPNNEDLATHLALKYCVSVLNFVPDIDDSIMHFFAESIEHGLQRSSVLEASVKIVLLGLLWQMPGSPLLCTDNSAVHTDRSVRLSYTTSAQRVLAACSDQLSKGNLDVEQPDASDLLLKVHGFIDTLWHILKRYLSAKTYAAAESLILMTAELLTHAPLRMITDQITIDPISVITMALPIVVNERSSESPQLFRPAHALWKVMHFLLFNASPEPPGRYERIMLRPALVPGCEVEAEDAFLAARFADQRAKPISTLAEVMQKYDMLLKTADIIVNAPSKNSEKYIELFMSPFLAMLRARPDVHEQILIPILAAFQDVCSSEDDSDYLDRATLLVRVLVVTHADDMQSQRIRDIFCYNSGRPWPMGLFGCVSFMMRSAERREGRAALAFNACRLFLYVCAEFHKWNPDLLQFAVPQDIREAEVALSVMTNMLTMMTKYQPPRLSNEAAGTLYKFLHTYVEERHA